MTRVRRQPVQVEHRDGTPVAFGSRQQAYVVREVLDHWTETGPWWRSPQVVALTSGEAARGGWFSGEQDWWRVEADTGRAAPLSAGTGVYDLCHDLGAGTWTLVRVQD